MSYAKTFEVPISYSESSENSVKHTDKTEIDLQGNINAKGNLGGGKSEKKKSKKKKEKEDESAAAAGAGASAGADAGASAEWKKTDSHETFDKNHQELHVGETKLEGKTNATYVPHGEQVFNVQLTLRALKIAELEVHHQPTLKKGAAIGAGAGLVLAQLVVQLQELLQGA